MEEGSMMKRTMWKPKHKATIKTELVSAEVPNPYFNKSHKESSTNPKTERVPRNLRESAVEILFARGKLDESQKKAADRFRALWEACGGAGVAAMDYSRISVDGGGSRDALTERQADAGAQLRSCRTILGIRNYALVGQVCGQGLSLGQISNDPRAKLTMADNLRASLDDLAASWGITTRTANGLQSVVQ